MVLRLQLLAPIEGFKKNLENLKFTVGSRLGILLGATVQVLSTFEVIQLVSVNKAESAPPACEADGAESDLYDRRLFWVSDPFEVARVRGSPLTYTERRHCKRQFY